MSCDGRRIAHWMVKRVESVEPERGDSLLRQWLKEKRQLGCRTPKKASRQ